MFYSFETFTRGENNMYYAFGSEAKEQTHTFVATPMNCDKCVAKVRAGLNTLEGDIHFTYNFSTKRITITAPAGISTSNIISALKSAGITATDVNLNTTAQPSSAVKPWSFW